MKQITGLNDTLKFGKYKGKTVQYVLDNDVSYIQWIINQNILLFNNEVVGLIITKVIDECNENHSNLLNSLRDVEPDWEDMNPDWGIKRLIKLI